MVRPVLVVAALAISSPAGASPRAGKVVRVERPTGRPQGTPRLCEVSTTDLTAFCIGKRPELGEVLSVIDSHHVLATLRVETAQPMGSNCTPPQSWMVQVKLESGDVNTSSSDPQTMGLLDLALDSRNAHLMKLDRVPGDRKVTLDSVWAVDTNGDGAPDVAFVKTQCDDSGQPSSAPTGACIEVWYPAGRNFELLRTDRIPASCF